jgi:hypothetical protein
MRSIPNVTALMSGRANTGAVSELLASADLLRRGYDVFRAVSPQCPCDLVAMRDGVCLRVEVRTGTPYLATGTVGVPLRETDRFDVLAVVVADTIGYLGKQFDPAAFPFQITDALRAKILAKVYPETIAGGRD